MEQIENRMVVNSEWDDNPDYIRCEKCSCKIHKGDYFYSFRGTDICEDCAPKYIEEHYMERYDG